MDITTSQISSPLRDLLKAVRLLKQRRVPGRAAVPPSLIGILSYIDSLPTGCHGRDLAARTALDQSTVSRAVTALVTQGLVAREPDPQDGRASILVVTTAGQAALTDAMRWYGRVLDDALADWSSADIAVLSDLMARFAQAITTTLTSDHSLETAA